MGRLTGQTMSLHGQVIDVTFTADEFQDGALPPIVSISTQMDGGAEYSPMKMTTASIGFLVDGVELMRLLAIDAPVAVTIADSNKVLFQGWVVPNSYNQTVTGINDIVVIECVDGLGYAKYVNYERGDSFSVMTLAELFARAISRLGIAEVRIAQDVLVLSYNGDRSAQYDLLRVSDNIFYKGVNPEEIDGNLIYEPIAMTYEEVLRMIAESLRLTWVQVGDILYLVDEVKIADSTTVAVYRNSDGDDYEDGVMRNISEDSFSSSSCNVSTKPKCSRVVINHAEGDERYIQPSLFNREHLRPAENEPFIRQVSTDERVAILQMASLTYDEQDSSLIAYKRYPATEEMPRSYDDSWDVALRFLHVGTAVLSVARLRTTFRGAVAPTLGRGIKVNIALRTSKPSDGDWPWDGDELESAVMLHLRISATNKGITRYYCAYNGQWQSEAFDNPIYFRKRGDEYVFGAELSQAAAGNVIPLDEHGGMIDVELRTANTASWWEVAHIYRFEVVEAKVDSFAADNPSPTSKTEAKGQWQFNEVQEVTLPIDNYYYNTERAFGDIAGGVGCKRILVAGESLLDQAWKRARLGDRLMWEMALRDEANAITALDAFTCVQLWSGRKVVAGYTRDVLNNTITLTLI